MTDVEKFRTVLEEFTSITLVALSNHRFISYDFFFWLRLVRLFAVWLIIFLFSFLADEERKGQLIRMI